VNIRWFRLLGAGGDCADPRHKGGGCQAAHHAVRLLTSGLRHELPGTRNQWLLMLLLAWTDSSCCWLCMTCACYQ
jgi:hypothetical protein